MLCSPPPKHPGLLVCSDIESLEGNLVRFQDRFQPGSSGYYLGRARCEGGVEVESRVCVVRLGG